MTPHALPVDNHTSRRRLPDLSPAAFFRGANQACGAILSNLRRVFVLIWVVGLTYCLPLGTIGWLNKRFGFLHSMFLCYPASERLAKHYYFPFFIRHLLWRTSIHGFFVQGGKLGLILGTTTTENLFTRASNGPELTKLAARVERLQRLLAIDEVRYAGVLPHYLGKPNEHGRNVLLDQGSEAVAHLLVEAYDRLMASELHAPVILLGGMGAIGRRTAALFESQGVEVHVVDRRQDHDAWPIHLRGKRCLLIDVARKGARRQYIDRMWPEMSLLNETYPEPRGRELRELKSVGLSVFHVVGVAGKAVPAFPDAYRGGIPCCAMHDTEHAELLLTEL